MSHLEDLTEGAFQPVLDDPVISDPAAVKRVVFCSGKLYYELAAGAAEKEANRPAIVRLEQLYSFPELQIRALLSRYANAGEVVWAQEEPRNMGAWSWVAPRLAPLLQGRTLRYAGRPERASPAEGYHQAHAIEQARIVEDAISAG
jgi:2-oxoglutarate dehydrogenase E1 component